MRHLLTSSLSTILRAIASHMKKLGGKTLDGVLYRMRNGAAYQGLSFLSKQDFVYLSGMESFDSFVMSRWEDIEHADRHVGLDTEFDRHTQELCHQFVDFDVTSNRLAHGGA